MMCWSHVNSELISIPRYVEESGVSKTWLLRVYWCFVSTFLLDSLRPWHFSWLYLIPHLCSHSVRWFRSFCSSWHYVEEDMSLYILLSSANNASDDHFGRWFMNARKRISPRTDLWGTPDVTSASCDSAPYTMTSWDLPLRKLLIHQFALRRLPKTSSLCRRRSCRIYQRPWRSPLLLCLFIVLLWGF